MAALENIARRFQPPVIVGQIEKFQKTNDPETVLITLRDEWVPDDSPRNLGQIVVAYPANRAATMALRESFMMVCSPVNYRKNPDHRSGIVAIPLPKDNSWSLAS